MTMVKKSLIFLKIFIILLWITPVWSDQPREIEEELISQGQYDLIVQKNLFSPQRQEINEEGQSETSNVTLPMVIGLWKQEDNLRALIIAPNDPKQIPKWYLIEEEVSGYKIVDIDLYKEIVKFKSAGTTYEVGLENKSRAARKPLPVPKISKPRVSKEPERPPRKSESPKTPARKLPELFRPKGK